MELEYIKETSFDKADFSGNVIKAEYDRCSFTNCDMSNADMSQSLFLECHFTGCNLSLAQLKKTGFREAHFTDCKMLGLQLGDCDTFNLSFQFENCILNHSSFYKLKIKKTVFRNTKLEEVDFTETDLSGAVFDNCDLLQVNFDHANLEKADLRSAYNYTIDPQSNRIKKAKFSLAGIAGLLQQYDIDISY